MSRTYKSKVDLILTVPLALLPIALTIVVGIGRTKLPPLLLTGLFASFSLLICFIVWTVLTTDYTIDATFLSVRSGPFRWTIRLSDIHSVTSTRNPSSGPALSLDRLRIGYGERRSILISPRDRIDFLQDLERHRAAAASQQPGAIR